MIMGSYWPKKPTSITFRFWSNRSIISRVVESFHNRTSRLEWFESRWNKQVYSAHHGLPREVFDAAVFEYLAKNIHPEEFMDVDPEATLKSSYDKFLAILL